MPTLTLPPALGTRLGAAALTVLSAAGATWLATPTAMAQGEAGDIRIHRVGVPFGVSKDDPVVCRFYLDAVNFDSLPSVAYLIQAQPPLPTSATVTGTIALGPGSGAGHTDPLGLADGQYRLTWTAGNTPREKIFRVDCHDGRDAGRPGAPADPGGNGAAANGAGGNGFAGNQGADGNGDPGRIEDHGGNDEHGGDDHGRDAAAGAGGHEDGGPKGGVHAGGGGLVDTAAAYTPLTAAAAVGLVVVSGAVYLRLIRRRPHGAA
ncbi:hypothetical protein ACFY0F_18900 [Streptomyces sp. NPDC001544]|uniref:hypothetical protein n=1 Tax=Streptomyces sp. NPDC001544 TaxID=3364584 RepID=UPI003676A555